MKLPSFYLGDLVSDRTPYLQICVASDRKADRHKYGLGPAWRTPEEREAADYSEKKLISAYVNSVVRAELYLKLRNQVSPELHPFYNTFIAGVDRLSEEEWKGGIMLPRKFLADHRPLRLDEGGNLVDPLVVQERNGSAAALPNPAWIHAKEERAFWFLGGVEIPVAVEVERVSVVSHIATHWQTRYSIRMSVSVPDDNQCGMIKFARERAELETV